MNIVYIFFLFAVHYLCSVHGYIFTGISRNNIHSSYRLKSTFLRTKSHLSSYTAKICHTPLPHTKYHDFSPQRILKNFKLALVLMKGKIISYIAKFMTIAMITANSISNSGVLRVTAAVSSAIVTVLPQPVRAGVLTKYTQLSPQQKLATTPLFYVCNSGGNPYLQEDIQAGKSDQRIIVYFMSSEDANEYLNELAQSNSHNVNEFRLMTTSMEKITNKIQNRKQSRKLGKYSISTVFRIQPSSRQCENAQKLAGSPTECNFHLLTFETSLCMVQKRRRLVHKYET